MSAPLSCPSLTHSFVDNLFDFASSDAVVSTFMMYEEKHLCSQNKETLFSFHDHLFYFLFFFELLKIFHQSESLGSLIFGNTIQSKVFVS